MSIAGVAVGVPVDELSALTRVRQLQAMIEQARTQSAAALSRASALAPSEGTAGGSGDFATALGAAQADVAGGLSAASGLGATTGAGVEAGIAESATGGGAQYESLIERAATRHGLDPAILHGLIQQESGFDPSSTSSAGAAGLTQLMPGTAASLGVANPLDPAESIEGGARYLSQLMAQFGGNTTDALAAYNAGPGAVQRYGGVPPYAETESYVSKVLGYAEAYRRTHPSIEVAGNIA